MELAISNGHKLQWVELIKNKILKCLYSKEIAKKKTDWFANLSYMFIKTLKVNQNKKKQSKYREKWILLLNFKK